MLANKYGQKTDTKFSFFFEKRIFQETKTELGRTLLVLYMNKE